MFTLYSHPRCVAFIFVRQLPLVIFCLHVWFEVDCRCNSYDKLHFFYTLAIFDDMNVRERMLQNSKCFLLTVVQQVKQLNKFLRKILCRRGNSNQSGATVCDHTDAASRWIRRYITPIIHSFVNLSHYYLAFTHWQLLTTIVIVLSFKGCFLCSSSFLFVVKNGH